MPTISCEVKYGASVMTGSVVYSQRAWRNALKEVWAKVGWHLFENFVGKHFTKEGAEEYRDYNVTGDTELYRPRSGDDEFGKQFWQSYQGRKQKKYGHQLAMVFSGNTRDGARRATIYATSNGVRVAMPGLVHLNQYKPKVKEYGPHAGDAPLDLRADVLAISRSEAKDMRALHEKLMVERFGQKWLDNYTVTIKP
jgi:hypothetical protein